jgi:hypothetical protein
MLLLTLLLACSSPSEDSGPDAGPCPEGFSGDDCSFCTFDSAGQTCQPSEPAELFELEAIKSMSLEELGWTVESTIEDTDGTVIVGDISTPYAGVTLEGEDLDVTMTSRVAVYLPAGWPDDIPAQAEGKAMVYAAHFSGKVDSTVGATIARVTGMPVLYHGEYHANFTQLGYGSKGELSLDAGSKLFTRNICEPTGFVRGNFRRYMAEVDMRVITLAQRIGEERGGALERFALRGFSKEGHAAWLASVVDDRIEVAGAGGSPLQDLRAGPSHKIAQLGCDGDPEIEETAHTAVQSLEWYEHTPAGALHLNQEDITLNQRRLHPRFVLIDGDTHQPGSHDGEYFLLGAENSFLDAFDAVPFRYAREADSPAGGYDDDGDVTSTTVVPYLLAEALWRDDDPAQWYPKVERAEASIDEGMLSVYAEVSGAPEAVVLWASYSEDRSWSEEGQAPWYELELEPSGDGWATTVDLAAWGIEGMVIGWYVEGRNTLALGESEFARKDASPIRFLQEPEAGDCSDEEPQDFCEQG